MATDKFGHLNLRSNSELRLSEAAANGTSYVSLKSPAALAATLNLTLPGVDGSAGQVLATDASGVLSFVTRVAGPGSATDEALVRFDGTTGALIQDSNATLSDAGALTVVGAIQSNSSLVLQDPGAGTDTITIQAPTLGASYTLTLPVDDGTSGQVLSTNGAGVTSWVAQQTVQSHKSNWVTADTATKAITHSLGTLDVMVQVVDVATGATIEIDSVVRTSTSVVTVTASEAPPATDWRVLILAV